MRSHMIRPARVLLLHFLRPAVALEIGFVAGAAGWIAPADEKHQLAGVAAMERIEFPTMVDEAGAEDLMRMAALWTELSAGNTCGIHFRNLRNGAPRDTTT